MDARMPAQYQPDQQPHDERLHAPAHVIDMVLGVMRQTRRPSGPIPGTVDYARAARAEARVYADRIWQEAWHAGAAYGLARNNQPLVIDLSSLPDADDTRLAELIRAGIAQKPK
jgi:hypothetical protein